MSMPKPVLTGLAVVCLASSPCLADWDVKIGGELGEAAQSVQQTQDGGYIVAAWINYDGVPGDFDLGVLKLDADGTVAWQKAYGGDDDDRPYSIRQTPEGGFIVAGLTSSFGAGDTDVWVLKLFSDGSIDWQKRYGGGDDEVGWYIGETADLGYIVLGQIGISDVWVLKLLPDGSIDWQRTYAWAGHDPVHSIHQTLDGGYVMAGPSNDQSLRVVKLQADGSIEWQRAYPGGVGGFHAFSSIQQTEDEGYIVAATTALGVGDQDLWVLKLDQDGMPVWQRTYGGALGERSHSILETSDGGYVVAATSCSFATNCGDLDHDIWLLKLDGEGRVVWEKIRKGTLNIHASSPIDRTEDGGYVVGGRTLAPGVNQRTDMLLLKLDQDGEIPDPFCGTLGDSSALVTATSVDPLDVEIVVGETLVTPLATTAMAEDLDLGSVVNCFSEPVSNEPPVAVCQDVVRPAGDGCSAEVAPEEVDGGSFDPEGGTLVYALEPAGPFSPHQTAVTLTVSDVEGNSDTCAATVTVEDASGPTVSCNAPATLTPPDAPIAFTASATDACDVQALEITGFDCFWYNPADKRVDKTNSCVVSLADDTLTIGDTGGVNDTISWTVQATDASGNSTTHDCSVVVVNPGGGNP